MGTESKKPFCKLSGNNVRLYQPTRPVEVYDDYIHVEEFALMLEELGLDVSIERETGVFLTAKHKGDKYTFTVAEDQFPSECVDEWLENVNRWKVKTSQSAKVAKLRKKLKKLEGAA